MGMKITKFGGFFKINTKTRACLIPNPNHEIRKTKQAKKRTQKV